MDFSFPSETEQEDSLNPPTPLSSDSPQLSLNAMSRMPAFKMFCGYGTINHHKVRILVDGGNTYNFVQL